MLTTNDEWSHYIGFAVLQEITMKYAYSPEVCYTPAQEMNDLLTLC